MHSRSVDSPAATADYRRQARRIRANFATQPVLRHYALTNLATQQNAERPSPLRARAIHTSVRRVPPQCGRYLPTEPGTANSAVERGFADHSRDRLRAGAFTYTDRAHLLDMGEKLGIPRFRANLILALEQHRLDPIAVSHTEPNRNSWLPNVIAIVVVEAAVVGLFVWVCGL